MSRNFIHYVRRKLGGFKGKTLKAPWFAESQEPASGFERPFYHVTRAVDGPAAEVQPGDTIWLIGQLYSPWGNLPAGVDARVVVADVTCLSDGTNPKGYRYAAAASSRWFPLADATTVLRSLQTITQAGEIRQLWPETHKSVGGFLQRPRKLVTDALLRQWEKKIDAGGCDFISYRLRDGTQDAFVTASTLIKSGKCIWWDRWSLPRRLAERREYVRDNILQDHIYAHIVRAECVWGVCSPLYAESGSYSAEEMSLAKQLGTFQPIPSSPIINRSHP